MKSLRERNYLNSTADWKWYHKFCGIEMPSNFYTFHIFSTIIDENPQIERIIELGTYTGSMAIALGLEGIRKGIEVITINIHDELTLPTKKILNKLDVKIMICDIFSKREEIKNLFDKPVYLLCDNGNKKDEFAAFVPYLKSGSIVSAHDWEVEIAPKDIALFTNKLMPFHSDDWQKHNTQLATWIVK